MRRFSPFLPLLFCLLLFLVAACSSEPQYASPLEELIAGMQKEGTYSRSPFRGAILVMKNDSVLFNGTMDIAEGKYQQAIGLDSRFCIGGLTKSFTAALVLKMVEEGKLDLQAPISQYWPDFPPEKGDQMTLHQLLSHTSGLPQYKALGMEAEEFFKKNIKPQAYQAMIAEVELIAPPGQLYYYSDLGYTLIGCLLESLTGQSYAQLLRQYLTEPLGLHNTGYAPPMPDSLLSDFRYHESNNPIMHMIKDKAGYLKEERQRDLSNAYSAAGMHSSPNDLRRWLSALRNHQALSPASTELMFRPNLRGYCYGWHRNPQDLFRRNQGAPHYYHGGQIMNYHAMMAFYDDGTTIITMSNVRPLSNITTMHQLYLKANGLQEAVNELKAPNLKMRSQFRDDGGYAALENYYEQLSEKAGYTIFPRRWVLQSLIRFGPSEEQYRWIDDQVQQILTLNPDLSEGYINGLGYTYLRNEATDRAIALFQKNIERHPNSPNCYDSLGEAYLEAGDKEKARQQFEKAIQMAEQQNDSDIGTYRSHLESVDD